MPDTNIEEIIAHAITRDPKRWKDTMTPITPDAATLGKLFDLMEERQINYLLVGGIAMLNYVEGRNTQDIDLLLSLTDLERMPELTITSQDQDFARAIYGTELQVDLLLSDNQLFGQVLNDPAMAAVANFGSRAIPCISPQGLAILKLYALPSLYRQGQFQRANLYEGDLAALKIAVPELNLIQLVKQLQPHLLGSDLEQLSEISAEVESRARRLS